MPSQQERLCVECGTPFRGRIDKKFCSDPCRIAFNNRLNSDDISYLRSINNILRKNRRILVSMNPTGKNKVSHEKLIANGFDFNHFTSIYKTREGAFYYYCYEQGYLPIEKNYYLLVVKKEFSNT
ncbi:MAG: hypothetical protein WD824_16235 [Cyclobacteriaceae bacterium]